MMFSQINLAARLRNLELAIKANKERHQFGVWKCKVCEKEAPATVHQKRKTYCSSECMSNDYKKILVGDANPNFRNAANKVCLRCGSEYKSYSKNRKFCSNKCAKTKVSKPYKKQLILKLVKKKEEKPIRESALRQVFCIKCGKQFQKYKSSDQKYCSYKCHIDSGGAFRAGLAAKALIMNKYGPKKDANHNEIFEELRKGCEVYDLSKMGCGVPDGLAWVGGLWQLFDVKNPNTVYGRKGLNKTQKKWISQWRGGPVYLIYTKEEARRFANGDFSGLKKENSGYKEDIAA